MHEAVDRYGRLTVRSRPCAMQLLGPFRTLRAMLALSIRRSAVAGQEPRTTIVARNFPLEASDRLILCGHPRVV